MLTLGQTILNFELLDVLGVGGMGEVYRARDTTLNREVALKFLPADVAGKETICQRFKREAQTLASLNHPCVGQIYGYHQTDDTCFLSLELVNGKDLSDLLHDGPLALDEAVAICAKIAQGLEAAHAAEIVHRDLKPGNIRIRPDGSVKILDFGLATFAPQPEPASTVELSGTAILRLTGHGTIAGTPAYMSPEQTRGLPTDHRTDIWSFGCVLYECLCGRPAFFGSSIAEILSAIANGQPDWEALPSATPASLTALVRSCLQKEPQRRPRSMAELRNQLTSTFARTSEATSSAFDLAQQACQARDWQIAYRILHEADQRDELTPAGLELLGECARWTGRFRDVFDPMERAHTGYVAVGDNRGAVRTALELCSANDDAGRTALTTAWWQRATELLSELPECAEHARHAWFQSRSCGANGDLEAQELHAKRALELAQKFGDRNVEALALIDLSHVATTRGESEPALDLIKRATSLALGGEIDIFATGMVFCNAIWACRCRGEWQRAQEWTESSTRWVTHQHVDYFPGMCRVHRAEVLRIRGDLAAAEAECDAATRQVSQSMPAYATFPWSELGEVRRRRGDFAGAMDAFQQAISLGWDPQPGLSLLLLQQGETASSHRAIERTFHEPRPTMIREDRANLLTARATIALAAGEQSIAQQAVADLEQMAAQNATPWDIASASHAGGMLQLAAGRSTEAITDLNRARRLWAEMETPYELANTCVLLGRGLLSEGDAAQAAIELRAARDIYDRIGAEFDCTQTEQFLASLETRPPQNTNKQPQPIASQARMIREGDNWRLEFNGRNSQLRSTRGMVYLARLLSQPGIDCWAVELAGIGRTREQVNGRAADRGDAGEILDQAARSAYRQRAEELQQELAEIDAAADPYHAERLRTELDAIARELAAAVGIGGRPRRAKSSVERARQSVTKAIRGAIRKVGQADADLGRYLQATIKTGTACRFDADLREPVEWIVET